MSGAVEVFLDDTPGEIRGVASRNGRYTHLIIHRDDDVPQCRLGARAVGRVTDVNPGLRGAFMDLGAGPPAFLPLNRKDRVDQGERLEVVVIAEPRAGKGPVVRRMGPGEGAPRLLQAAPGVAERLQALAPNCPLIEGVAAIDAAVEAEEEALAARWGSAAYGVDLALERTRALVAVDIDYAPSPGRDARQGRAAANREGLHQAARLIGLRHWGGLVVIDLVGDGQDAEAQARIARAAFSHEPQAVFGPISRFGLLQMSLPWRMTPVEERLCDGGGPSVATRALALVRALRRRLLSETTTPRLSVRCPPEEAALAAPLVARLGPRAGLRSDDALPPGRGHIEEG
jgi:Ribonuclease G/E